MGQSGVILTGRDDRTRPASDAGRQAKQVSSNGRWVCLDVGETLIDETRVWSTWADVLGVPRFTLAAVIGGAIARGENHLEAFALLGRPNWAECAEVHKATYGGFRPEDLYPDALPTLTRLRTDGYAIAVIGNQPASSHDQLLALGVNVDVLAMSETLGVAKPDPAFFARALELMGSPEPRQVVYVGDRVENDVLPSLAAGMRAIWLRRGPWSLLQHLPPDIPAVLQARTLTELSTLLPACFTSP
jgi:HAD superfamily hydrolase (TIGR01509 family)